MDNYPVRLPYRLPLPLRGGAAPDYTSLVQALNPALWYRLREIGGTTAVNSGSFGTAQNGAWVPGVGAVGQTGQLGANEAYSFDNANSRIAVAQSGGNIGALAVWTKAFLFRLTGYGEAGTMLMETGTLGGIPQVKVNAFGNVQLSEWTGSIPTSANTVSSGVPVTLSEWQWLFATFDDAGERLVRAYVGKAGAVTQVSYGTLTAMSAARVALSTNCTIGNDASAGTTMNGLLDEMFMVNRILTTAEMLAIVQATGV